MSLSTLYQTYTRLLWQSSNRERYPPPQGMWLYVTAELKVNLSNPEALAVDDLHAGRKALEWVVNKFAEFNEQRVNLGNSVANVTHWWIVQKATSERT